MIFYIAHKAQLLRRSEVATLSCLEYDFGGASYSVGAAIKIVQFHWGEKSEG